MKRIGAIVSLSLLIAMLLTTSLCFAADLEIVDTYPKEGQHNLQAVNCGVKLWFSEDMYTPENTESLSQYFRIVDAEGKTIPSTANWREREKNMILVLATNELANDSEYKLYVSGDLMAANGDPLGEDLELTFGTRDTSKDMMASTIMMVVMFGGILFFSSKSMKKQMAKEQAEKEDKVNPYKIAKETGKPVEEVIAKLEKEKEKKARADARKARGKSGGADDDGSAYSADSDNKRVRGPRPISAAGSTYVTGRKAQAEAEAAAKAEAAKKAAAGSQRKGSKQQQKKKKK